jgi:hypothetical protein
MGASGTKTGLVVVADEKQQWNQMRMLLRHPTAEMCQAFLERNIGSKAQAEEHLKNVESLSNKIGYQNLMVVVQRVIHMMKHAPASLEGGHLLERHRYGITFNEMKSLLVIIGVAWVFYVATTSVIQAVNADTAIPFLQLLIALGTAFTPSSKMEGLSALVGVASLGTIFYVFKLNKYVSVKKIFNSVFNGVYIHFPVGFQVMKKTYKTLKADLCSSGQRLGGDVAADQRVGADQRASAADLAAIAALARQPAAYKQRRGQSPAARPTAAYKPIPQSPAARPIAASPPPLPSAADMALEIEKRRKTQREQRARAADRRLKGTPPQEDEEVQEVQAPPPQEDEEVQEVIDLTQ